MPEQSGDREGVATLRMLNLLWALPVVGYILYWNALLQRFQMCGVFGCAGAYPFEPDVWMIVVTFAIAVTVCTVILLLTPWTKNLKLKLIASPGAVLVIAFGMLVVLGLPR
ncbi:hypothetical protein [Microterricola viridarii]|uniref:Uncharacterized protein n=1 Tax=Microterricola viridarii TaxID=412690 RepID=A0A1H1UL81_9MICO|nr:hypothetical protein [Microterricola viridarii]SDS73262.1 hypothetical protein SAMN04489834_2037 [Microterricola viridarii]